MFASQGTILGLGTLHIFLGKEDLFTFCILIITHCGLWGSKFKLEMSKISGACISQ